VKGPRKRAFSCGVEYGVAIEKCDALPGIAKDACVSGARALHGKS
jgi:hypothetical protein